MSIENIIIIILGFAFTNTLTWYQERKKFDKRAEQLEAIYKGIIKKLKKDLEEAYKNKN